jgi:hypothetical protein
MTKFQYTFRYIDDLCLFNVSNPRDFLSPDQSRNEDNPYWIYPLNVLEIKEEISEFSQADPRKGITVHFMNAEFRVNETIPNLTNDIVYHSHIHSTLSLRQTNRYTRLTI